MTLSRILYGCLALIVCLGVLTGCWDRKETDDLALVMASGLDLADDGRLEVTLQIALPTGIPGSFQSGGKSMKPVLVISAKGKDGTDVLSTLQQQLSRRIFLGHRGVIVIGEKYARHGIDRVLDTLLRSPDSRYNSFIVTAFGSTAKEILNSPYQLEGIPAMGMNKIQNGEFSLGIRTEKFLDALASYGTSPVTGAIRLINKGTDRQTFVIDKAAVYQGSKLTGFLSGWEVRIFQLFKKEINDMKLQTQLEPPKPEFNGTVAVALLKTKTRISTRIRNGVPEATVSFKAIARLRGNDTSLDMSKPNQIIRVEKKFSDDMEKTIASIVSRSQKFKSDIFGVGSEIHIEHPYAWKKMKNKWDALYPEVPIHVKAEFRILRVGRTQAPAHKKMPD